MYQRDTKQDLLMNKEKNKFTVMIIVLLNINNNTIQSTSQ